MSTRVGCFVSELGVGGGKQWMEGGGEEDGLSDTTGVWTSSLTRLCFLYGCFFCQERHQHNLPPPVERVPPPGRQAARSHSRWCSPMPLLLPVLLLLVLVITPHSECLPPPIFSLLITLGGGNIHAPYQLLSLILFYIILRWFCHSRSLELLANQ